MQIKRLPIETKQAFQVIKKYIGTNSNNAAFAFCVAVAAKEVHREILETELAKVEEKKDEQEECS